MTTKNSDSPTQKIPDRRSINEQKDYSIEINNDKVNKLDNLNVDDLIKKVKDTKKE